MSALLEKLLRMPEVEDLTGLDRSTIYRKIKADPPQFPLPVKIGARSIAFKASELQAYLEERIRKGREEWLAERPQALAEAKKRRAGPGGQ